MEDLSETQAAGGLAAAIRHLLLDGPWSAAAGAEEAAYWAEQRQTVIQYGRPLLLVLVVLDFLWWPSDLVLLHGKSAVVQAFAVSRGWAGLSTVLICVLMPRIEALRRHPCFWVTLQIASVAFVVGYEFGALSGPGDPWFNYTPYILLTPTTLPFRMKQRLWATLWLDFALIAGFFLLHPANLVDLRAGSALLFVAGVACFEILAGAFTDRMRRRIFFLQRATERQALELKDLNEHLESRVREQTGQVRQLASHLESARESERAHIARELHDELGQDLAALRYALKFARIRYQQDPSAIGPYLDDLEQLVGRTTATTRGILSSLRPTVVDDLGLSAAAEWIAKRMQERIGIECRLEMPAEDLQLPKPVATTAFRILQEALTNVARHAQAKCVSVALAPVPGALELSVQDDGVGFTGEPAPAGTSGMGLIGMRERVLAVGGTLEIKSEPNCGTLIRVRLPVSEGSPEVAA